MLAIISDLHLQHVAEDGIRFRADAKLREAGVVRNVGAGALQRFLHMALSSARRRDAKALEIVLAGDIFELHRTPRWFYGSSPVRPYGDAGPDAPVPDGNVLRSRILDILERIVEDNKAFFDALKRFVRKGTVLFRGATHSARKEGVTTVRVHYLPGNHDRLANAWGTVRRRIREILCIDPADDAPFPYVVEDPLPDGQVYETRVRHGQEYDSTNFSLKAEGGEFLSATPEDYLKPCFGDYVTIDVAARLAVAFRAYHARGLHADTPEGERLRALYLALTEFDDVRPSSLVVEYLSRSLKATEGTTFELLRPALRDVVEAAAAHGFFKSEAKRLGYWNGTAATALREGLKHLSGATIAKLAQRLLGESGGGGGPASHARHERGLGEGVRTIVAGHTHSPEEVSLPAVATQVPYYVNSGTWRTILPDGEDSFGRLRAYTMVFVYDGNEGAKGDKRRFETWTGRLLEESYGPYEEDVADAPAPGPAQWLRFLSLAVDKVDEANAELDVHFGVDGTGHDYAQNGVSENDELDLSALAPLPLDPGLDGEVWFWGLEKDLGTVIDMDDLLPWAVARLRRKGDAFLPGEDQLVIEGWSGFRFRLKYEVV